jgi:Restriction endonuclease
VCRRQGKYKPLANKGDNVEAEPKLFVWRGDILFNRIDTNVYKPYPPPYGHIDEQMKKGGICPFCNIALSDSLKQIKFDRIIKFGHQERKNICNICGFTRVRQLYTDASLADEQDIAMGTEADRFQVEDKLSTIQNYGINNEELHLHEIGSHLKNNYSDIYQLSPRKFEELVADVFKNSGYTVELTPQTKDGGVDIFILKGSDIENIIVECKRYSEKRKVGVSVVRSMLGVQLLRNSKEAKIVTTSGFTLGAINEASIANNVTSYNLDLVDANELLSLLNVYNTALPKLQNLDYFKS